MSPATVNVRLYDQAGVATPLLDQAKADVQRVLGEAGVQIEWLEVPPESSGGRFTVQVVLRRRPTGFAGGPTVMGSTLGASHETSGTSFVFLDRVLQRAHEREQDVARVLAYAIAHELGHLLLPYPAHSETGIMRAEWDGDDLRHIASGMLRFTPAEGALIREKLATCCDGSVARK
jgi:hypothetical protein